MNDSRYYVYLIFNLIFHNFQEISICEWHQFIDDRSTFISSLPFDFARMLNVETAPKNCTKRLQDVHLIQSLCTTYYLYE